MEKYVIKVYGMMRVVEAVNKKDAKRLAMEEALELAEISVKKASEDDIAYYEAMKS